MSANYATVKSVQHLKDVIYQYELKTVELTNKLAVQTKKLARIQDICNQVQALVDKVNQMYNDFFGPAERARLRSARNLKGIL
jgi:hypothetical protein